MLDGVICIRLDAMVTPAHSHKQGAAPNFKGYGHHPLLAYCDTPLKGWPGCCGRAAPGSSTVTDHLQITDAAIAASPASTGAA